MQKEQEELRNDISVVDYDEGLWINQGKQRKFVFVLVLACPCNIKKIDIKITVISIVLFEECDFTGYFLSLLDVLCKNDNIWACIERRKEK